MLTSENKEIIKQTQASQWLKSLDLFLASCSQLHELDFRDAQGMFEIFRQEVLKPIEVVDDDILAVFFIFHRNQIKPSLVGHIFKTLSFEYTKSNAVMKLQDPNQFVDGVYAFDENRLYAIIKKAGESGMDLGELHDKLLEFMVSPETRAGLNLCFGDHYLVNCANNDTALEYYMKAVEEDASCLAGHQRILAISEFNRHWAQVCETLKILIDLVDNDEDRIRYLLRLSWIHSEHLHNDADAIEVLKQVVLIDPNYLATWLRMIRIYQRQDDFESLKSCISEAQTPDIKAQLINCSAALYKKSGDALIDSDISGAAAAYQRAFDLLPQNIGLLTVLAKLYESDESTLEKAVVANRKLIAFSLDHPTAMQDLARCYRLLGKFDESLCTYRMINALHPENTEAKEIVDKFAKLDIQITQKIPDELWPHIIPATLDNSIAKILKYCTKIIGDLFANDFSTYQINEKEAFIDISADTTFNNTIRNETEALGFAEVPLLYRCDRFSGVTNAYFTRRSFLIHPNCLSGRSHKALAFMTAKALLLMRPEFYLLQLGPQNVDLILRAIFQTIKPSLGLELDKNQTQVSKLLISTLTPDLYQTLAELVKDVYDRNAFNPELFLESVEDFANRIGLLFSNSPAVVEELLTEEANPISQRTPNERLRSLILWALTEDYFIVRKKLNIALKG